MRPAGSKRYRRRVSFTEPGSEQKEARPLPQTTPRRRKETVEDRECPEDSRRSAQLLCPSTAVGDPGAYAFGVPLGLRSEVLAHLSLLWPVGDSRAGTESHPSPDPPRVHAHSSDPVPAAR